MKLNDLEVYRLAKEISRDAWELYKKFDWQTKKVIGDQWIESADSVGANIAEGFGRFHYLDKNKFNYNARGSAYEATHWTELLMERDKIDRKAGDMLIQKLNRLLVKLNNLISSTKDQRTKAT